MRTMRSLLNGGSARIALTSVVLPEAGAASHKNVFPVNDGAANDIGTSGRQDSLGNIIVEREDDRCPLANGEHRPFGQWGQQPLEAFAAARQNAGDGRTIRRDGLAHMACQQPDRRLGGRLLDSAHFLASDAGPIDPKTFRPDWP